MSVVEEEITLPVVTFKRQRVGNKVYLRRIVKETLDQIQNASIAQENPKFKVMTSRDVIVDKFNLIKSFGRGDDYSGLKGTLSVRASKFA